MTTLHQTGLRILVGAASFADAAEAMRIIDRLPASFYSSIGGLLIEDMDTLAVCQIPDQRIISQSGVATLAPDFSQIRCVIAADARAFKLSLASAARPRNTEWAFEQGQGDLVATSLRGAKGWDVLILGYRKAHKVSGKIILLGGPEPTSKEMEMTSQNLSRNIGKDTVTFAVNNDDSKSFNPETIGTFQFSTFEDSLAALTRTNALAVLVDMTNGPIQSQYDLTRLLEAARCPLVIFGATGVRS